MNEFTALAALKCVGGFFRTTANNMGIFQQLKLHFWEELRREGRNPPPLFLKFRLIKLTDRVDSHKEFSSWYVCHFIADHPV